MNKPLQPRPVPDEDIGPLDENGVQIWTRDEEAAIARLDADPEERRLLDQARADVAAGRMYTSEEVNASMREMKRNWFAERGIAPPPGYFDS